MIITALSGGGKFYTPLVVVITIGLIVFLILWAFEFLKSKILIISFVSFLGVCALATTGYEINKSYINSLATVNEQGVNLNQYKLFTEKTKAVKLDEVSTLKIENTLPVLDGATALYPLYSAFAQAAYPEKEYSIYDSQVMCSNTIGSYKNLIEGKADIIFCARPSQLQLDEAKRKGVEFKLTPIGREAFVFFVNSKNNVEGLTTKQIQDIYSGKIVNWKELGGKNKKIRAFQRPQDSGSQTMLQKLMEGQTLIEPPKEDVATGMGEIIDKTSNYRNYNNAIGYSFLFFATEMVQNNQIKLLKVDGVYPDRKAINNKEYPLSSDFYAVTAGSKNPNVDRFIEWILSPQGQKIVEKTGYTPLK
jgi:phosphate transport system substrate-binding protein